MTYGTPSDQIEYDPKGLRSEGNPDDWHIRLIKKMGDIEVWALFLRDDPQSSGNSKETALKWMREEIARKK